MSFHNNRERDILIYNPVPGVHLTNLISSQLFKSASALIMLSLTCKIIMYFVVKIAIVSISLSFQHLWPPAWQLNLRLSACLKSSFTKISLHTNRTNWFLPYHASGNKRNPSKIPVEQNVFRLDRESNTKYSNTDVFTFSFCHNRYSLLVLIIIFFHIIIFCFNSTWCGPRHSWIL